MQDEVAVISAADAEFFDLLRGLISSLRDKAHGRDVALYIFDLGLTEAQRRWLLVQGAKLHQPDIDPGDDRYPRYMRAFWARCRIPEFFPGHSVYAWIDADAWVQRWDAVEMLAENALRRGFAVVPENDPAYPRDFVVDWHNASFAMFGAEAQAGLQALGPINAGVFTGRADAPHWQAWQGLIEANREKATNPNLLFALDQTALCLVCRQLAAETALLPTTCNWLANFARPVVSDDGAALLHPLPPHEPLGIVHQASSTKRRFYRLPRRSGGFLSRTLGYQAHSVLAADEYVSPGLQVVLPDRCFPNMVRGDQAASNWPFLRKGLPHAWLVDRRIPTWGFLNRDEAHILYNLALQFCGASALEIGCLMGWSACHMALAGVDLDVIDPMLAKSEVLERVRKSIEEAQPAGRVTLCAARSPGAVHQLAKERPGGWSSFFIDGNHDGDAPAEDAKACERYAARDCAMVFHDLASPYVTNAARYMQRRGWRVRVYHTAQIMAVAWRGNVSPLVHRPDPRVDWQIPDHVMPLLT